MMSTALDTPSQLTDSRHDHGMPTWMRALIALLALYIFIASVKMIGTGLKVIAENPVGDTFLKERIFGLADDPFTGLFVGILITALVQSSSFTTAMTVAFVAEGSIGLTMAIPVIMGANIGTSITGLLVSLGRVRHRDEFKRSLAAASCHDFFNVLSVILFFPLELKFRIISGPVTRIAAALGDTKIFAANPTKEHMGIIKTFVSLPGKGVKSVMLKGLHLSDVVGGTVIAVFAIILLFAALWLLVKMLRGLIQGRLSGVFNKALFRNGATAFVVGIIMTVSVQSSSVTTSLIVPLVGAEVLRLQQVFPYLLGANVGTTVTAMLAALSLGSAGAVACACGHLLFNIYGTIVFWPLKRIPIGIAEWFADLASKRRILAFAYILVIFFVIPATILSISKWLGS
jgi:sodium-dependent phosphate cotransporter